MHRINHHTGRLDTAIQAEFLKMLEGSQVYVTDDEDKLGMPFDTTKVLIICAGAFTPTPMKPGLIEQILRRTERPPEFADNEAFWPLIEQQDFIRFGVIPELAGRLARVIFLRPLRKEHLAQ